MAYQIGFDLYASATQQFLSRVQGSLRSSGPLPEASSEATEAETKEGYVESCWVDNVSEKDYCQSLYV